MLCPTQALGRLMTERDDDRPLHEHDILTVVVVAFLLIMMWCFAHATPAQARDMGQWEGSSPETRAWFRSLVQPDTLVSCCGDADGYYADEYHVAANGDL